jgi:hypothetical protein
MAGIHSIKSKDSRRKLRRWGFVATITRPGGNAAGQNMPGVMYGDHVEAKAVAERLKDAFTAKNPDAQTTVTVEPVPYETVSIETKRQFEGLNDQASLIAKAAFILAEKYRLSVGVIDKDVAQIVNEAIEEARQFLFPRLEQAKAKATALSDELSQGEVVTDKELEPKMKNRKRGIEAVREALEGTDVDEGSLLHLEEPAEEAV